MILNPETIRCLDDTARLYKDDEFFAVHTRPFDGKPEWFVFNWVFGLSFMEDEVMRCPHLDRLLQQADIVAKDPVLCDILHHISQRSWRDILIGPCVFHDVIRTPMKADEKAAFDKRKLPAIAFRSDNGFRYYVRERYYQIAESVFPKAEPVIIRPMAKENVRHYRPMLFNHLGELRGMLCTLNSTILKNPFPHATKYQQYIEEALPEIFGEPYAKKGHRSRTRHFPRPSPGHHPR